ncbi:MULTISPECIES: ABC transporter permease [Pseudovibrio]|jgi:peptide/nickel transport system permease protein|uniref:Peptide/nickel transport system permease protein n=1 Tax=Pseudovibrio ascidiaceicola TaxID=285279 RepID=A0A1I3VMV1_9HYPH|nr:MULTISPECIES: ABC transporter permease [Pseudovibrio]KZL16376.1 putative D,D-dipeptide transport system permease protein DdpC [Pseudovibrio sp. Ad26]KZL24713.1 putative D,D-dipeptide transport system permease protein DdpC [Pseudovibrio sp. WM33]SFJ95646.1 peptide/nickel transport system permease protein [Pseudovibrio ascidiaceicola]
MTIETSLKPPRKQLFSGDTPMSRFLSEFVESKVAVVAALLLFTIIMAALFAPWITPQNPYDLAQVSVLDARMEPGEQSFDGYTFWLGTDGAGRDLFSAILYGLRISLSVGVTSGIIALIIGMSVGLIAAYVGGRTETFIMRIVDLQLSFPASLVALMLLALMGKGVDKIILALVVAQWAYYARTVRGTALVERGKEYVEAVTCLGLSHARVLFLHIMPNCLPPLIVVGTVQTAHAIALEATLSFLGVGLPQTEPSLGLLIANGFEYVISGKYWISIFPGIALLVTVVAINLVGDQLRDVLNPRLRK